MAAQQFNKIALNFLNGIALVFDLLLSYTGTLRLTHWSTGLKFRIALCQFGHLYTSVFAASFEHFCHKSD